MSAEANKLIARRYFEDIFSQGNLAVSAEIIAPSIRYGLPAGRPRHGQPGRVGNSTWNHP